MSLLDKRTDHARRPSKRALLDLDLADDGIVIYEHADKQFTIDVGSERCILTPDEFRLFVVRVMRIGQAKGWTANDDSARQEEATDEETPPAEGGAEAEPDRAEATGPGDADPVALAGGVEPKGEGLGGEVQDHEPTARADRKRAKRSRVVPAGDPIRVASDASSRLGHSLAARRAQEGCEMNVTVNKPCPRCQEPGTFQHDGLLEWEQWCVTCQQTFAVCLKCGRPYTAPMSPYCKDDHAAPTTYHPFIPYFDFALGVEVTSLAERHKHMRNAHVDYRDKLTKGQLSERADRAQQRKREQDRGHEAGGSQRTSGRVFSR